jgi:hypothetical protein
VQENKAPGRHRCRRTRHQTGRGVRQQGAKAGRGAEEQGTRQVEVQTTRHQAGRGAGEQGTRQAEVQENKAPGRQRCRRTRR